MKEHLIAALAAAVFVSSSCVTSNAAQSASTSWEGHYLGSAAASAGTAVAAEVDVFAAYEGQALYIDFKIERPDGVLLGAVANGQDLTATQFRFSFRDTSGTPGNGTFSRSGARVVLRLAGTDKPAMSQPSDALYGEYTLSKTEAKGRTDRHPWSLGRNQPRPPDRPSAPPTP